MSAVATNVAVIVVLHPRMGFRSIALGTALGSIANVLVLAGVFQARQGGLVREVATSSLARMIAAAALMSVVCWFLARVLIERLGTDGLAANLIVGLGPVVLGGAVYLAATAALRVPEVGDLLAAVRRRARG
jgi:peptidoglycan biosynthesis protein MviN/MurJ (putative lipid II flippase)